MLASGKNISQLLDLLSTAKTDVIPLKTLLIKIAKALYMEYMGVKCLFFHLVWTGRLKIDVESKLIDLSKPLHVEVLGTSDYPSSEVSRHA
ncbi:hypothetical protein D9M70_614730 [compost metagenome]